MHRPPSPDPSTIRPARRSCRSRGYRLRASGPDETGCSLEGLETVASAAAPAIPSIQMKSLGRAVVAFTLCSVSPFAQGQQTVPPDGQGQPQSFVCLHGSGESPSHRQRRELALDAAWLILEKHRWSGEPIFVTRSRNGQPPEVIPPPPVPSWWRGGSTVAFDSRFYVGPRREVEDAIRWGAEEPLPGWRIEWSLQGPDTRRRYRYAFRLIDALDPCAFSHSSDDLSQFQRNFRVVPVA